jgi:hypothetical protein
MGGNTNERFGLEIPELTVAQQKWSRTTGYDQGIEAEYHEALVDSVGLRERVGDFLTKNGVQPIAGSNCPYIFGISSIIENDADDPKAPIGLSFFGSEELAQKVANAFPQNRVLKYDGTVIPPTQPNAEKTARPRRSGINP